VEEIDRNASAKPLKRAPQQAVSELFRIKLDTFFGMAVSNIVAIAIMLSAAATLHAGKRISEAQRMLEKR
jgi:ABC-type phosphate/phosphonate transport system permease subunit